MSDEEANMGTTYLNDKRCNNQDCHCNKTFRQKDRSWKCKLGFHDLHLSTHGYYQCRRQSCEAWEAI